MERILTPFGEMFRWERCLKFKRGTNGTAPKILYLNFAHIFYCVDILF